MWLGDFHILVTDMFLMHFGGSLSVVPYLSNDQGENKKMNHAHKTGPWYILGETCKFFDKHA